jgi:hypothetical protein
MTIVATSIPVLRVFFRQAVNSAISTYQNSSREGRYRSNASTNQANASNSTTSKLGHKKNLKSLTNDATLASSSKRRSNAVITGDASQESLVDPYDKAQEAYNMDNLVVDEETGRVTMVIPDRLTPSIEEGTQQRPHTRL